MVRAEQKAPNIRQNQWENKGNGGAKQENTLTRRRHDVRIAQRTLFEPQSAGRITFALCPLEQDHEAVDGFHKRLRAFNLLG